MSQENIHFPADHAEDAPDIPVEEEDKGTEQVIEPFDPTKIRIDTRPMTVDLLVKRMREKEIDMSPAFQREAGLWRDSAQSRLIESLLIRIPIPAFYMDATDENKWLVVDGLQRLTVFKRFVYDQSLKLTGLEFLSDFENKRFDELPRSMQRRIEETQVIVYLIQPGTPPNVKFNIFKRINTGGLPLSPQEIRHALNQGPAAEMLRELAESKEFQRVAGTSIRDQRMTDRECVLRFLAFVTKPYQEYKSQDLDGFLNSQMKELHGMSPAEREALRKRFGRAMEAAFQLFGSDAFRKRYNPKHHRKPINKALFEAWSVNLDALSNVELDALISRRSNVREAFMSLMSNDKAFDTAISQGTGDVQRVKVRFERIATLIREVLA